jgi:hypothetical protein
MAVAIKVGYFCHVPASRKSRPRHGGNTGSNPVRVASIVVDGPLVKCITLSHNKCIKICLHSLTY